MKRTLLPLKSRIRAHYIPATVESQLALRMFFKRDEKNIGEFVGLVSAWLKHCYAHDISKVVRGLRNNIKTTSNDLFINRSKSDVFYALLVHTKYISGQYLNDKSP